MKKIILLVSVFIVSSNSWAMNLTKKLQVTRISYNKDLKNYDVMFELRSGIYHSSEVHLKCLQKSIDNKSPVSIEYEAMGLKIVKCSL